jgi:hypothetical protein
MVKAKIFGIFQVRGKLPRPNQHNLLSNSLLSRFGYPPSPLESSLPHFLAAMIHNEDRFVDISDSVFHFVTGNLTHNDDWPAILDWCRSNFHVHPFAIEELAGSLLITLSTGLG